MMPNTPTPPALAKSISRETVLILIKTALSVGETSYARRISLAWLASFPGDLQINFLYARALLQENNQALRKQARYILNDLCEMDPEYLEAQDLLAQVGRSAEHDSVGLPAGCALALGGIPGAFSKDRREHIPKWASQLREVRRILIKSASNQNSVLEKAEWLVHQALLDSPSTPLASVFHLKIVRMNKNLPITTIRHLAQIYHKRWPNCLQFKLFFADALMDGGEADVAVDLLHQVVVQDITGQVPTRTWGEDHPYRALWPESLEIEVSGPTSPQHIPIPAAVAAALGWNQLPERVISVTQVPEENHNNEPPIEPKPTCNCNGTTNQSGQSRINNSNPPSDTLPDLKPTVSTSPEPAQVELERLANSLKQPHLAQMDGRFPMYVVLTTRKGLEEQYGPKSAIILEGALKNLVRVIRGARIGYAKWGALLFFADDPAYTSSYNLKPVPHNDPYMLKLALTDLDMALGKRGEMIGAILIVGGPQVVPFHHLPNPVDDIDVDVPSDNPYSTRDENYFVPEWPVGRLPGGEGCDPSLLLSALQNIIDCYASRTHSRPWHKQWWLRLLEILGFRRSKEKQSLGYTAAIWRRASLSVFRSIGEPRSLLVSPPIQACDNSNGKRRKREASNANTDDLSCIVLPPVQLGYFNLHGLPDAVEWYGQRDPTEPGHEPDFPVALRPEDIRNGGSAPRVVFSEACYGSHIIGKRADEAISLKFLVAGSRAVVGSTCISYGSITTPLIAADLLGRVFWKLVGDGFPVGEALRHAKLHLAHEMHRRQGYLDGEDQKTLISFVLYGDPLAQPLVLRRASKTITRSLKMPSQINTVCDRSSASESLSPISPKIMAQVRHTVSQYLPGMAGAKINVSREHMDCSHACNGCHSARLCPTAQIQTKIQSSLKPDRKVVTLSKTIEQDRHIHQQYARLTLDSKGKLVKLAVSR